MVSGGYWHIKEGVLGDRERIKRSGTLASLYAGGKVELFERQSASASADEPLGYVSVTLRLR